MSDRRRQLGPVRISAPATSANLGPGFDAVGLAFSLRLTVEARPADADGIEAVGRDASRCRELRDNLILGTYRSVLEAAGEAAPALHLHVENDIPLGMGCGSSAAARVVGVSLASHFGTLGLTPEDILLEASRREGHPDNVAACVFGGFTIAVDAGKQIEVASTGGDDTWQLLLMLPEVGLATEKARALLPDQLTREDAVFNLQRTALLTAAFFGQRPELLRTAMEDRLHQPHRREACVLLKELHRLQHGNEFAGVSLSGAGPALLGILRPEATLHLAEQRARDVLGSTVELLPVRIGGRTTSEAL